MNNPVLSWIGDETVLQGMVAGQSTIVLLLIIVFCIAMLSFLSLIHISEPTRLRLKSRMP